MACRGCTNLQCNCFTANSDSTITKGNGSQYAPFTFRPDYVPFPRPFGHLFGRSDQSLDGAVYSLFEVVSFSDVDGGGNMNTGNRTTLTVPAGGDGLYLAGITVPYDTTSIDGQVNNFSLRKNGIQVSTATWDDSSSVHVMVAVMTATTLLDLNAGDTLDCFVERVVGAGSVTVQFFDASAVVFHPHMWAVWMGGPI